MVKLILVWVAEEVMEVQESSLHLNGFVYVLSPIQDSGLKYGHFFPHHHTFLVSFTLLIN